MKSVSIDINVVFIILLSVHVYESHHLLMFVVSDSELRVQSAVQRALKAEEALEAALEKIQDLERQLQGQPSVEPKTSEGTD